MYGVKTHELGKKKKQISVYITCTFYNKSESMTIA